MSAPKLFSKLYRADKGNDAGIVVMLHGWGLNHAVWTQTAQQLSTKFQVHCIDLPGHGKSTLEDSWKRPNIGLLQHTVDEIFATISALKKPVTLIGWSLGGHVAMEFAMQHPALISKLVLVSTTPCFNARADWPHAMAAQTLADFSHRLQTNQAATIRSFLCLQMLNLPNAKSVAQSLSLQLGEHGAASANALNSWLAVLEQSDIRAQISQLHKTPMLIVQGGRDMLVPVSCGDYLSVAWPHAQYLRIDAAAHAPFISHPEIFMTHLEKFLPDAPEIE